MSSFEPPDIPGADALAKRVGYWPTFHDAEIIRVHIERDGESRVTVRLAQQPLDVHFVFKGITYLAFEGEDVNCQNVLGAIGIDVVPGTVRVDFGPSYGLYGWIKAKDVRVELG